VLAESLGRPRSAVFPKRLPAVRIIWLTGITFDLSDKGRNPLARNLGEWEVTTARQGRSGRSGRSGRLAERLVTRAAAAWVH
jgi:transposase